MKTKSLKIISTPLFSLPDTVYADLAKILQSSGIAPMRYPVTCGARSQKRSSSHSDAGHPVSQIGKVIIYIEEHLAEQLNLEKLAGETELSKYQLIRHFRDETGSTPWQFLIGRRIELAKELLEKGNPPGRVAAEAGFYDQSHLTRILREETGLTPKEYQVKFFRNKN